MIPNLPSESPVFRLELTEPIEVASPVATPDASPVVDGRSSSAPSESSHSSLWGRLAAWCELMGANKPLGPGRLL